MTGEEKIERQKRIDFMNGKLSAEELLMEMTMERIHEEAEKQKDEKFRDLVQAANSDFEIYTEYPKRRIDLISLLCKEWLWLDSISRMAVFKEGDTIPVPLSFKIRRCTCDGGF